MTPDLTRTAFLGVLALAASLSGCSKQPAVMANARETLLTPGAGVRLTPVPSPDGRWLAYTAKDETDAPTVYVMPQDGGESKRLLPAGSRGAALGWTSDSQDLLVLFLTEEGPRIQVYGLSGELRQNLPTTPQATFVNVSADGRRYLWRKLNGDSWDVGVSSDEDSTWQALATTPEWETDACFGPSAGEVTVVRQAYFSATTSELGIYSTTNSTWTPLPLPKALNAEPAWDPGKTVLAFISNRAGSGDLWIYDSRNTRLTQITSGPEEETNPCWSPDGASVIFARKVNTSHIFAGDPRTLEAVQITEGEARDFFPRGSPDGRWVAFFRKLAPQGTGPVETQLCVMPAAEASPVTVLDLGGLVPTVGPWMFAWSPDAQHLVFAADDGTGNVDLYSVARENGQPSRITIAPGQDIIPNWSPDGKQIAYTRTAAGETQIWAIPSTGGLPVQLSLHEGASQAPVWSPDSNHLAYMTASGGEMFEVRVTSLSKPHENRILLESRKSILPADWSAEGDLVFVLGETPRGLTIQAVPVSGKASFLIAESDSTSQHNFFRFDPRFLRYRERFYRGNLNVYADGTELSHIVRIDVSPMLDPGYQAARD